jgi:hypothetical protein
MGLAESIKAVLEEMRGDTVCAEERLASMEKEAGAVADNVIKQVTAKIKPYWNV